MSQTALVITSIAPPTFPALVTYAKECKNKGIPFIVMGDTKSPNNFELDGCDYWSIDRQLTLDFKFPQICPTKHYARKNIGYLVALKNGAQTIIETDDDNLPRDGFWKFDEHKRSVKAYDIKEEGWLNVYNHFSDKIVWPRGLPLEELQKPTTPLSNFEFKDVTCPIHQGLADENPDVDAVFRLTYPLPMDFNQSENVALGNNTWCPFNSQNTFWFKEAMPLMYLPAHCSFRMTDIWRSFIAQRIAWANGWSILFHKANVWQERNEHNLLKDFEDEIPGYLNNSAIGKALGALDLPAGQEHIYNNLIKCYDTMIENGWVGAEEKALVAAWCEDLQSVLK